MADVAHGPAPSRDRPRIAAAVMLASGFAGLGYQIVWTQQCALWLGHESAAVLAVVTAFFGGLAFGGLTIGPRLEPSSTAARWYAACEIVIAVWSVALTLGMAPVSQFLLALTGAEPAAAWQWAVAFLGTFLMLLPATAAMGATLPLMARVSLGLAPPAGSGHVHRTMAGLYACNTVGAVVGVLATAFWLVPEWGLARTAGVCALLNLVCAAAVMAFASHAGPNANAGTPSVPARGQGSAARGDLALLAATGLLGIGYEVLVVRVLSQVAEDTVYTFALLLAIYLVGSAIGAAAYRRWQRGSHDGAGLGGGLLCLLAAACLLGTASLWPAEALNSGVARSLGFGMAAALAGEAAMALAAFGLPTIAMGALFSHLAAHAVSGGASFSRALGFNTLGAAAAPFVFGVILAPTFGTKAALLSVAMAYLLLAWRRAWRGPLFWAPALAGVALALLAPPLVLVTVPEGGQLRSYREGTMAAVSVVEDAEGTATLRIDNRQIEGSSATGLADGRQALLPLLLHAEPHRMLFLGLGTGMTASAAARDETVEVDAVELLPEVIAASAEFNPALDAGAARAEVPRLHLIAADARRYVRTTARRYDVIVSDNFHPARSGSGALYTVEHFEAVRSRLAEGGVFCQWLPLHQIDLESLRSVVRTFMAAYPQAGAMLATNSLETPVLGLVGRADGRRFDVQALRQHLEARQGPLRLVQSGLADEFALLGSFIAGPQALAAFAGNAPLNTDDRPVVAYRAPRITYAPDSLPRERLAALLNALRVAPGELVDAGADAAWLRRLAAYRDARDRFIEVGQHVKPLADPRLMLAQVGAPLLEVLRISPDFRPAYDPLLRMAAALEPLDAPAAQALLEALKRLQPARPEADQALSRFAGLP